MGGRRLTASAGVAGWIEFLLLRASLNRRAGATGLAASYAARLWAAAIAGAVAGWGVKLALPPIDPIVRAALVLPAFGATYLAGAWITGVPLARISRRDGG